MNAVTRQESQQLALNNPLDRLFAKYKQDRDAVEKIAAFTAQAPQVRFFFDAAIANSRSFSFSAGEFFRADTAIKAIDAEYWQKAMLLTDVLEYMPAGKRNEWHEQIQKHKTPPFEIESVKQTLIQLLNSRDKFLAERVDGLFHALSHDHVTNIPQGFGKRFIIGGMLSYSSIDYRRANYIHDLRSVIGKFMGRPIGNSNSTSQDLSNMGRDGKWNEFDGGAFRIRLYKRGTAHMEVHPDIAYQLNQVLAFLYPMAIPAEFRTKPARKAKEHKLHDDLAPFDVIKELERGIPYHAAEAIHLTYEHKEPPSQPTIEVIEKMGGKKVAKNMWEFGYLIAPVLTELSRTGRIPNAKSHQFYPTPKDLALIAVNMARIQPGNKCLEPSAGQGALAELMPKTTTCVEVSYLHAAILEAKGYKVECFDFISWAGYQREQLRKFDRIVMNPPFSNGRARDHLTAAISLLAIKDGILVAILPASFKDKTYCPYKHEWSDVFVDQFEGASVNVAILKISS